MEQSRNSSEAEHARRASDAPIPSSLTYDERLVVIAYRRVKERRHGDLEVSVKNGGLVKVWEVVKNDLNSDRLTEVKT